MKTESCNCKTYVNTFYKGFDTMSTLVSELLELVVHVTVIFCNNGNLFWESSSQLLQFSIQTLKV